jgi:hypothetical protein
MSYGLGEYKMAKKKNKSKKNNPSRNSDQHFALNQDSFIRDFLPVYKERGLQPKLLVQFPVLLPFHIPVPQGMCVTFGISDDEACTFHFSDVNTSHNVTAGIITKHSLKVPVRNSRVEMICVFSNEPKVQTDELLNKCFDSLLDYLNNVILSYLIFKKDIYVHQVSKEMLEFGCIYRIIPVEKWGDTTEGLFLTHMSVPYERETLKVEEQEQLVWYANVIKQQLNPYIFSEELMLNADRYLKTGFYKEAVLYAQSSVETFLNVLYGGLLQLEGKTELEIQTILEDIAFMKVVKRELPERLGGTWTVEVESSKTGQWFKHTYKVRNRVAHGGYRPSLTEAREAVDAAKEFRVFVIDRIRANKKKYPELQQYFTAKKTVDVEATDSP